MPSEKQRQQQVAEAFTAPDPDLEAEERGEVVNNMASRSSKRNGTDDAVKSDKKKGETSAPSTNKKDTKKVDTNKKNTNKKRNNNLILLTALILALLALIIGLSVGLTNRNKSPSPSPTPPPSETNTAGEGIGIGSLRTSTLYTSAATDPLPWSLPSFGDNVLDGYDDCEELRDDLEMAGAYLANVVIGRNVEYFGGYGGGGGGVWEDGATEEAMPEMAVDESAMMGDGADMMDSIAADAPPPGAEDGTGGEGESDWETNTQVEGVDEADVVKSDGTFVFAAYGDRLVHFDATYGRKLSETTMPAPYFDEEACMGDYGYGPEPFPVEEGLVDFEEEVEEEDFGGRGRHRHLRRQMQRHKQDRKLRRGNSKNNKDNNNNKNRRTSMVADMYWPCHRPQARIESLLLEGDRLVVIVSGYGQNNRGGNVYDQADQPILGDVGTTKVRVYDTKSFVPNEYNADEGGDGEEKKPGHPSQLKLVGTRDLPGYYAQKGGRSIGNRAYLVSHNYLNTWYHFERHFDRWQITYDGLDDDEYRAAAIQYAQDKVIPNFVDRLMAEIQEDSEDGGCSHIQKVAMYQTGDVDATSHHWWDSGIFNGLTQITSFDLDQAPVAAAAAADDDSAEPILQAEKSVAFVPSTWGTTVYATQDMLFLATQGYDEHPKSRSGFIQSTFILGFSLDGDGSAKGAMVGKVPGIVLSENSQFSLDYYDGYLRVATTTWSDWVCPFEEPTIVMDEEEMIGDGEVDFAEDAELSDEPEPLPSMEAEPIFCGDSRFRGPHNQITILSTDSGEIMNQVGYLGGLGKPGESIYAVRFIQNKGFVVTFQRIDPFYTLDLSDPFNPMVVGELEISGFSNYIHPTEDPNVLIAVGEDADEQGRVLGVQLTLFGVHDFSNPKLLARYNIEQSDEAWSSTEVQFDHRAFRYLKGSQRVILPAQVKGYRGSYDSFDGFYIFKINKDSPDEKERIELKHEIDLAPDEEELWTYCYSPSRLSARSMMFDGKAMLMKNHAVESHDLDLPEGAPTLVWRLDMDDPVSEEELRKGQCYYWW